MRYLTLIFMAIALAGCNVTSRPKNSDEIQREQQESILNEGTSQIGMPAIKNFRERKLYKDILELRDQDGLTTYTYIVAEMTGKLVFIGESIGYGIPYATQFTNPQKIECYGSRPNEPGHSTWLAMPQADPNGLFAPASADGTWVLLKNPNGKQVRPVYIEPRVIVSPFPLSTTEIAEK